MSNITFSQAKLKGVERQRLIQAVQAWIGSWPRAKARPLGKSCYNAYMTAEYKLKVV